MAWIYLGLAGILEVIWAYFMKKSEGFSLLTPSAITIVTMIGSFILLSIAMRSLPLGTAYAVWTGIGAVGTALMGMLLFGESREVARLVCIGLIVAGIVGLKVVTPDGS
mgnify:CR=1 FL=1